MGQEEEAWEPRLSGCKLVYARGLNNKAQGATLSDLGWTTVEAIRERRYMSVCLSHLAVQQKSTLRISYTSVKVFKSTCRAYQMQIPGFAVLLIGQGLGICI